MVVGWRDDDGFVRRLEQLETLAIPRIVRGKENMWDGAVAAKFLEILLKRLRTAAQTCNTVTARYDSRSGTVTIEPAAPGRPSVL